MIRYCINCKKDIDFPIKSIKDLDSLVCPVCGNQVGKNNRNPEIVNNDDKIEQGIGNAVGVLFRILYLFYFLFAFPSMFFYYFSLTKALYVCTIINVVFYILQLIFWGRRFWIGVVLIPVGAALAYYFLRTIAGVCLGIQIVFLAYFVIRGLLLDLLFRFIGWATK